MRTDTPTPSALRGSLEDLRRRFTPMADSERSPRSAWDLASNYRVLTILGGRGSGKTTLLNRFTEEIDKRDEVVVLSPLQPEMFTPIDTIFSVLVARLRSLLSSEVGDEAIGREELELRIMGARYNLGQALDRLLRGAAIIHDVGGLQATAQSSLSQFSSEFVTHALAGEEFTELLDATLQASCRALAVDPAKPPLLVVPIDDADLAPGLLANILRDVRVLAKSPDVVVCLCLDLAETRRVLAADYLRELSLNLSEPVAASIVEAQLSKALPTQQRVTLRELSRIERLDFTPLGLDRPPLIELLSEVKMRTPRGDFEVGRLFQLENHATDNLDPSPYASCLPSNPRALENLHHQLHSLVSRSEGEETNIAEVGWLLASTAVQNGFQRTPHAAVPPERMLRMERNPYEDEKPRIEIDFSPVSFSRTTRYPPVALNTGSASPSLTVRLGTLGFPSGKLEEEEKGDSNDLAVDDSLTLGLLLAREFTLYGEEFYEDLVGGEPVVGGQGNELLNIHVGVERGDGFFLVPPRWRTYYDYFLIDEAWHISLERQRSISHSFELDPVELVAGLVVGFLQMVADTHDSRRPQPIEIETLKALGAESGRREALEALWEKARQTIDDLSDFSPSPSRREEQFKVWIANYMPMVCHPWLMPHWLIEEILALRNKVCDRHRIANFELRSMLQNRIRQRLGEAWITPLFEVFAEIPSLDLESIWPLHESAVQLRETERDRVSTLPAFEYADLPEPELARHAVTVLRDMISETKRELEQQE